MNKKMVVVSLCLFLGSLLFAEIIYLNGTNGDLKAFDSFARANVVRTVDGDTIVVKFNPREKGLAEQETVRLVGVDTPETKDPRKPVQYFGAEASAFTKARLTGQNVRLAFDTDLRDRYGRILCYVFLEDRQLFNYNLVYYGYGFAYTVFPFVFQKDFLKAQQSAKDNKKGLWAD